MEKIVFLDRKTVNATFRTPSFLHQWIDHPMTPKYQVVERLADATIAITNKVQIRKEEIDQLPHLRMVAVAATGTDCIDVKYCAEKGIVVSNVRNYAPFSVPEHVFTLLLALRRNLISYNQFTKSGEWQKSDIFCSLDYPNHDLHNSTLGIIGHGVLGKAVEKLALAFGMKVLIAEHKGIKSARKGRVTFEQAIYLSDVISLHCPLTNETRGLLGEKEFKQMKRTSLLINCGRGGLVDETALVSALQSGEIAGAGIDVLSTEPPTSGNPLLDTNLPNLIITPHIAWASVEAMQVLADQLINNLETFINGSPQNVVN
ncbi:MAG TPA: D-2-hydroxyacid dehydrogenase [Pyrinomonadaceae bacterium]|nr:D-2-hydroxyacid dehydrogenase [Pyrinomonadaceae bacterium]